MTVFAFFILQSLAFLARSSLHGHGAEVTAPPSSAQQLCQQDGTGECLDSTYRHYDDIVSMIQVSNNIHKASQLGSLALPPADTKAKKASTNGSQNVEIQVTEGQQSMTVNVSFPVAATDEKVTIALPSAAAPPKGIAAAALEGQVAKPIETNVEGTERQGNIIMNGLMAGAMAGSMADKAAGSVRDAVPGLSDVPFLTGSNILLLGIVAAVTFILTRYVWVSPEPQTETYSPRAWDKPETESASSSVPESGTVDVDNQDLSREGGDHTASSDRFSDSVSEQFSNWTLIMQGDGHAGWPAFWTMTFAGGFCEGLCMFVTPGIVYAHMAGGYDPCMEGEKHYDKALCAKTTVQFLGLFGSVGFLSLILSFFAAPIVAKLCDEVGRRPLIMLRGAMSKLHALALYMVWAYDISVMWLVASFVILAVVPKGAIWTLWIADRVDVRRRTQFFALLTWTSCCYSLVVPVAILLGSTGSNLALCLGSGLICALISIFAIPESLTPARRQELGADQTLQGSYSDGISLATRNSKMRTLCAMSCVGCAVASGIGCIAFPWLKLRFQVSLQDMAPMAFIHAICELGFTLCLVMPLTVHLGLKKIVLLGWFCFMMNMTIMMSVPTFSWLYLAMPFAVCSTVGGPALGAWFLNAAPPAQLAQMQAILTQMGTVCMGIGPILFSMMFASALNNKGWGSPFLAYNAPLLLAVAMGMLAVSLVLRLPSGAFADGPVDDYYEEPHEVVREEPPQDFPELKKQKI